MIKMVKMIEVIKIIRITKITETIKTIKKFMITNYFQPTQKILKINCLQKQRKTTQKSYTKI
jgi:hypothetical protein